MTAPAPSFRERLAFDEARGEILDETRRYMLLRPEALMGVFRRLPDDARMQALDALEQSVFEQGSDSARAYRALGSDDAEKLLQTFRTSAPQLGWGRWRFETLDDAIRLEVSNSPFAKGFGRSEHPVCHAIVGVMRAFSGMAFGKPARVRELKCAAMGGDICQFEARPDDGR